MKRRDFARSGLAAAILAASPAALRAQQRRIPWQNWSGYLRCVPESRVSPRNEDQLAELLRKSPAPLRPVGAGHSFTPLVPTEGSIISLRRFNQVEDAGNLRAHIGAGLRLGHAGEPLHGLGQALSNMPDIDEQTFAGAMATATHGTGAQLSALHDAAVGIRLVTPRGEVIDCSKDKHPEVFRAAQVSLGSLGVITRYTLQNVPEYKLIRRTWLEPLDSLMERFDELADGHRSFEMYYIPFADKGMAITTDFTDEPVSPRTEEPDNDALRDLQLLRDYFGWSDGLRRWLISKATEEVEAEENVDLWYRIFPSDRSVRFNEMEYHLPRESLQETFAKVKHTIESGHSDVFFPVEIRVVKQDDAWLSPFYGRATASIAVHKYFEDDPLPLQRAVEPHFRAAGGRPHWGKMNTLQHDDFARLYPRWKEFTEVRRELDPEGRMLNPYLKTVFGLPA